MSGLPAGYDNWRTSGPPESDGTACEECGSENVEIDDDGIYGYDIMCNACGARTSVANPNID